MKIIKNTSEVGSKQKVQKEFVLLLEINHENILRYFEHFEDVYADLDCSFIITEYCHVYNEQFYIFNFFLHIYQIKSYNNHFN